MVFVAIQLHSYRGINYFIKAISSILISLISLLFWIEFRDRKLKDLQRLLLPRF